MSDGRIGLPDVQRDEDNLDFFAPHGRCLICKRALGIASDPASLDCGGDCLGCIRAIEDPDLVPDGYVEVLPRVHDGRVFEREEEVGTTPAKETGHKPPSVSPASSSDSNADLVGLSIPNVGIVQGTCSWSDGMYVAVEGADGARTCRLAGLVRALNATKTSPTLVGERGGNT